MSIKFRDTNKVTKEELKLHLVEELLSKRFADYNNSELKNSLCNPNGFFNEIYHTFNNWIFNE